MYCNGCGSRLVAGQSFCNNCGRPVAVPAGGPYAAAYAVPSVPNPGLAAVFSFFIPGLGQIYRGKVITGLVWLAATSVGYFLLVVPGLILHLLCIIDAYRRR